MIHKNVSTKTFITVMLVFSIFLPSLAQDQSYTEFYHKSMQYNNTGMYVLGGWAVANLIIGGIGWNQNTGDTKYFHQMNFFWNTVNLSIAGFALYNNLSGGFEDLTNEMMVQKHYKIEKLYLINGGLDLAYIGTGFLLKNLSPKKEKNKNLLNGYGNSLILQGSFLLVFDAIMWGIQRDHRLQFLENVDISFNQINKCTEMVFSLTF
jgi:hypothetical protein